MDLARLASFPAMLETQHPGFLLGARSGIAGTAPGVVSAIAVHVPLEALSYLVHEL